MRMKERRDLIKVWLMVDLSDPTGVQSAMVVESYRGDFHLGVRVFRLWEVSFRVAKSGILVESRLSKDDSETLSDFAWKISSGCKDDCLE